MARIPKTNDTTPQTTPDAQEIERYTKEMMVAARFFEKHWWRHADRMIHMYELDHYYDPVSRDIPVVDYDRIKVPYPYANARQILAEIYAQNPEPIVKPTKMDKPLTGLANLDSPESFQPMLTVMGTEGQSRQVDLIKGANKLKGCIEYCIRKSSMKRNTKIAILDGIVTGLGVIQFSAQKNSKIPAYRRVVYRDLLWSPDVYNPYDSPYIYHRHIRPLEDVKKDERYDQTVREKVTANSKYDPTLTGDITDRLAQFEYVVVWSRWDKKNNSHCEWADGSSEFLLKKAMSDEYNFQTEADEFEYDWPYDFFVNEEMLSACFGIGDLRPIESQVRELDKTRSQMVNHRKRFNRKYMTKKGFMDAQAINQFKNPDDGTVVEVRDDITPLNFQVIQDAPMSRDVYNIEEIIQRDIQTIQPIGPNSLVRGVGQQPGTLGEAEIIEQNSAPRMNEKKDNVAEFFRRLFRYTAQYIQQYWVEEDVILVTGDGSQPTDWLEYSPEEIRAEWDFDVDPKTLQDNSAVYRKQAAEALQIVGPTLAQLNPQGLPVLIRKYLETFGWKDLDRIMPEDIALPQPGMSPAGETGDPAQELMGLIQSGDPNAFIDSINQLPDNERQVITEQIQSLLGGQSPTNSAIAGAANRI